ncbi:hypothetical protein CDAR_15791 [Caerostris darwini]|uniref:Uncharacterized protein n=1 Tax=Caerostris darwini TaxID=1538125 RepID=A0AAV4N794_9ARAC|nr:hypothetical protein CDAR_15791 [Caerostris darwini]
MLSLPRLMLILCMHFQRSFVKSVRMLFNSLSKVMGARRSRVPMLDEILAESVVSDVGILHLRTCVTYLIGFIACNLYVLGINAGFSRNCPFLDIGFRKAGQPLHDHYRNSSCV